MASKRKKRPCSVGSGGNRLGSPLTRGGLQKITRVSPHTFRHTFTVMFLRAGGSQFALMDALGHTNPQMSRK